ncbi:hypothetical protein DB345_03470 [Spartobacteria bacterium LR76]|nr:hypothetical protein DB345_03470 [Spartobacteria bacterium LR76]
MSEEKIRITTEDIAALDIAEVSAPVPAQGAKAEDGVWGTVGEEDQGGEAKASFWLKSWVYLGLAGAAGALVGWMIFEPWFDDYPVRSLVGNMVFLPGVMAMIAVALGLADSLVERSWTKVAMAACLSFPLGAVFGFVFGFVSNITFYLEKQILLEAGVVVAKDSPALWIARALVWMIFGIGGGVCFGLAGRSGRKCLYGVAGGVVGAFIGGILFDPISIVAHGAEASRALGMVCFGLASGIAIGFVESALKDRWLYVVAGPLAGKQFVIYKEVTQVGRRQTNDIYLFKDETIEPLHARIERRGAASMLVAQGPVYVGGQPVTQRALRTGDLIKIGRYTFRYEEKPVKKKNG